MKYKALLIVPAACLISYAFGGQSCSTNNKSMPVKKDTAGIAIPANTQYKIVYFLTEKKQQPVEDFLAERQDQAKKLTHVIYFPLSITVDSKGNMARMTSGEERDWQDLTAASETGGFKVLFGFHENMNDIRSVLQNEACRTRLIGDLVSLQSKLNGAGMDFDIEYPMSDADTKLLGDFFKDLRAAIGDKVLITADVGPKSYTGSSSGHLEGPVINEYLNWVNLMCYGKGSLNSIDFMKTAISEYVNKKVDPHKIVIGLPFFAKAFYVNDQDERVPFNPGYNYLVDHITPDDLTTDTLPFNKKGADPDYLLFNSPNTIQKKAAVAKLYGGVMAWHWRCDVTNDHSLTKAIIRGRDD